MAHNIFKGFNYLFSPRVDPIFAIAIGIAAATLRIRREETCHRLGLPSNSMVSIIEQERHKFDDTPPSRSRLAMSSWSIGDSREANFIRQDVMRNKRNLVKNEQPEFSSASPAPLVSRDPETGEFVLETPPAPSTSSGAGSSELKDRQLSKEESRRRDEEFKRKFREAQPGLLELATMFGSRATWLFTKNWTEYWEKPWFWYRWSRGWASWQTSSKESNKDQSG